MSEYASESESGRQARVLRMSTVCRQRGGRSSHHSSQAGRKECNEAMTIDKDDGEQAKGEE
jgi:hypothetical protein